ncbi:hypothetical protein MJC1_03178 [Methylocystis sp. MJC1]|jgi:nucleoside phosphorylase/CheY-like chemotaxis protein|nr:response regulator [Methylocystis sp. MJC1]KAF2989832.1 hypothetical protein MJC1_03178 [Methylocystis sp. MJC1]
MVKVLIVEDDAEKLRRVCQCLLAVPGIAIETMEDARDVVSAKRLLREKQYDLLVLDISLPERADQAPAHSSGISLLSEMLERDIYAVPKHIIGLTAYEDARELALPSFERDVLQLVFYDPASREWEEKLHRIAKRVVQSESNPVSTPDYQTHLCILTALATPELEAVLRLPWAWKPLILPNDPSVYQEGSFGRDNQSFKVIAASAPRMGMAASAVLATKMAMTFRPRYLAMVGIAAGVAGECELGDILVADPGWDYESGKRTIRNRKPVFAAQPHQVSLDPFLRGKLGKMAQDRAILDEIRRGWYGFDPKTILSMRLGPVASGAAVIEDPSIVDGIKFQNRKTIGVEMETYGVLIAADECPQPQPTCFSMKSVCDYADPHKNNEFQKYAAYTSATALKEFAERFL